jgi:hypothetical protein
VNYRVLDMIWFAAVCVLAVLVLGFMVWLVLKAS